MADEKIFTIPLRREFVKKPKYKRTKKAITLIKEFIAKHMKNNDVRVSLELNNYIWGQGNRNPPPKIKVKSKIIDEKAYVQLIDKSFPEKKEDTKKEKKEHTEEKKPSEPTKEEKAKELKEATESNERTKLQVTAPQKDVKISNAQRKEQRVTRVIAETGKKDA